MLSPAEDMLPTLSIADISKLSLYILNSGMLILQILTNILLLRQWLNLNVSPPQVRSNSDYRYLQLNHMPTKPKIAIVPDLKQIQRLTFLLNSLLTVFLFILFVCFVSETCRTPKVANTEQQNVAIKSGPFDASSVNSGALGNEYRAQWCAQWQFRQVKRKRKILTLREIQPTQNKSAAVP